MGDNFNGVKNKMVNTVKKLFKLKIKIIVIILVLILILLSAAVYWLTIDDGTYKEDDWSNTPYAASQYTNNFNVENDGKLTTSMTAQELWDKMIENGSRVDLYLDSPEELLKLMNAEVITQYLDTRPNPDEEIDWDTINDINSKEIQGIIKLKRADTSGKISTMIYTDPATFQKYIDEYNSSGSESAKKKALKYFTLEKMTSSSSGSGSGSGQSASPITAGTTIKIPSGLGSVHTYMGWQIISSPSSTQYKLREKTGMPFDEEGFGKINGRYVIACTTTFGTVGDYIDFYQEDGTVIQCIIGDIKNQNDSGCNKWGHDNGHCIIEFVVNKNTWYNSGHGNPGTSACHPEWNKNLTKAVNGGSYFDNPNFGSEAVAENGNTIEDDEDNDSNKTNANDSDGWCWPTDGDRITSTFGPRSAPVPGASTDHGAIDIGVPVGTNVYACDDGKVITAGWSNSAGNWVVIDHGNGYVTTYMHNSELKVSKGDKVTKGQVIAKSGSTGHSSGPHVHFQVEYNDEKKDPLTFKYYNSDKGDGSNSVSSSESSSKDSNEKSENTKYYAKVATWSETTNTVESNDSETESSSSTTYNMTTTNINYQEVVSSYTMPFDYLWALLVVGDDKDFVLALADLVYSSELEITVHDNLTVNTNTVVNTYTKKKRTDSEAQVTVQYGEESVSENSISVKGTWSDEDSKDYKVTETTITKENTLDVALTKANVWIVNYLQEYKYQKPQTTTTNDTRTLDNKDYPSTPDETSTADTYGHASALLEEQKAIYSEAYSNVDGIIDYIKENIYNATVNRNVNTTNVTETTKYISSPAKIEEKTDIDAEEDNFVTLLNKDECRKAKLDILNVEEWLFEILENNDSTKDMVDLTKYLLYKLTGHSYGVDEYDFGAYEPSSFEEISESTSSDYIVKTNDSNAAPVVDKKKLEEGIKKWLKSSSKMKKNALSVIDVVFKGQEKYNVNAVFTYAFLRNETGIGTANSHWVKEDNNWGSWNLGHKFTSPEDNIETITRNMKNGDIYFTKGNTSVSKIGAIYCPNTPQYPTQGDKWIEDVNNYMADLYKCMGIETSGSVASGGKGTIGVYTSSTGQKYNLYLQGNPAPWRKEDYGNLHSMALAGCGPTAEAIIASAYNADITPSTTRKDIVDHLGGGNHSSATWIGQSLKRLIPGIKTNVGPFNESKIKSCLKNSGQVWLVVQHCKYTGDAHCIALIDYKESNKVYVAHGTAKSKPYGWDDLSYIRQYNKHSTILYVGGS